MVLFLLPNPSSSMIIVFLWSALLFLQATEKVKCTMSSLLIHGTGPWFPLLVIFVMIIVFFFSHHWMCEVVMYSPIYCSFYVVTIECPGRREVQRLLSLFWSAALASLIHRNPLREYCSPVDWRILEENAPLASEWSTTLEVESWAQHPPHTNSARVQSVRGLIRGPFGAKILCIHRCYWGLRESLQVFWEVSEHKERLEYKLEIFIIKVIHIFIDLMLKNEIHALDFYFWLSY